MATLTLQPLKRLLWGVLLLALVSSIFFPDLARAQSLMGIVQSPKTTLKQGSAREIFQRAYERRYTWDQQFPGYSADVSLRYNKRLYHGLIRVNPDLSVVVTSLDEPVRQLVADQLQMVAVHHKRVPFEAIHGQHSFQLTGTDNQGAVEIQEGDSLHYKVRDRKITQVNRLLGPVALTVNALGFFTPPEGYLVAHYQSISRDAQTGKALETQDVRDIYDKVGKYYLLTRRYIRRSDPSQPTPGLEADTLISFDAIQPLRGPKV